MVSDLINVRYRPASPGSNAAVLISAADPDAADRISTDGRYITQVAEQSGDLEAVIARNCLAALVEHAGQGGTVRVGFEEHIVTVAAHRDLDGDLGGYIRAGKLCVKSKIRARWNCCGGPAWWPTRHWPRSSNGDCSPGRTEREVARALEWEMFERGADAVSFETIVATGANSAIPHHRPTRRCWPPGTS